MHVYRYCDADKWPQQHIATSLGVAEATNISEILSEAGPTGLHATEIAKKADTDASKIGSFPARC